MNEKHKQYFNVTNDKKLIEKRMPTAKDLSIFEDWKVIKREQLKKTSINMIVILLFIIIVRNSFE